MSASAEGASADQCVVCRPWAAEDRPRMRASLTVVPLREEVCEACLRAWWASLPWGPPAEGRG